MIPLVNIIFHKNGGMSNAHTSVMMCGFITECDFDMVDEAFPGIVRYYWEMKEKPKTFLELLWAYTHRGCALAEPPKVATRPAIRAVSR